MPAIAGVDGASPTGPARNVAAYRWHGITRLCRLAQRGPAQTGGGFRVAVKTAVPHRQKPAAFLAPRDVIPRQQRLAAFLAVKGQRFQRGGSMGQRELWGVLLASSGCGEAANCESYLLPHHIKAARLLRDSAKIKKEDVISYVKMLSKVGVKPVTMIRAG